MSTFVQKLFQVFFERFNCVCGVFMLINERIFVIFIRFHISDTKGIRTRKHTVLWARICTVHLTVCYHHVTHAFQSESTPYSCLDLKEILARNKRDIWSLSDSNRIRTPNYLICERTIIDLAKLSKWLSCIASTYLYGAFYCMSRTHFRMNLHSRVAWMSRKSVPETGAISEV